jgi:hypothetical protein
MNREQRIADFNKKMEYAIKHPEEIWKKLNVLHNKIMSHPRYVDMIDSETRFMFEFACVGNFWPIRDNIMLSISLWTILKGS